MALVIPANAQLDNNQNGMSDPWERRFNQGNLFDISQAAHQPDADPDGDGFTNSKESITGTNPFQGQTSEGVIRAMVAQTAAGRELKWPVVPGKRYTAQHSATLAAGSWKAVGQPMVAAKGQAEGSLVIPPHLLAGTGFFQVAVRDVDTDEDGLADAEEHLLGTSPLHSYSLHGVGDYWLAKHFTDLGSFDPDAAPHGDGMTYREAYQLNLDPHTPRDMQARSVNNAVVGDEAFINGDFTQPSIGTGVRKEVTNAQWDYWDTTSGWDTNVNGWTAVNGTNIELQKFYIAEGNPYCELQAHPDAHNGLKQTIKVVPGKTYLFMLDYRARANVTSGVQVFADETELTLSDLAEVDGWTPKVATFIKPASSEDESEEKVEVTFKITPPTGGTAGGTGFVKNVRLLPVEVDYIMPNSQTWEDVISDSRVIMNDESTKIRIQIKGISLYAAQLDQAGLEGLYLKTNLTRAGLPEVLLPFSHKTCTVIQKQDLTEIRYELTAFDLSALNLLPSSGQPDFSVYSALDYNAGAPSNFLDSQAFLDRMAAGLQGPPAGYANNKPNVNLFSVPPQSLPHTTFMQSAGAEVLCARFGTIKKSRQVMNQGKMFYFSGHGGDGDYMYGPTFPISDDDSVDALDLKAYWTGGLDIAIIAGCYVVNINNWHPDDITFSTGTIGPGAGYYPGKFMNTTGPRFILGYGNKAPADDQNSDKIIAEFTNSYLENKSTPFTAWRNANDNPNGRNATAIEKNTRYGYFEKVTLLGVTVDYAWTIKNYSEW